MKPFRKHSISNDSQKTLRQWSFSKMRKKIPAPSRSFSWKRMIGLIILLSATLFVGTLSILLLQVLKDLPDITDQRALIFSESTVILDSTGKVQLYAVHGDQNRKIIPIEEMSSNMISAILAAEDDQFYVHSGFDMGGITMAFLP
jgi:membrane peptidoglycan carboxypeptidase